MRDWPLHAPGLENSLVRELREDSSAKPTSLSREVCVKLLSPRSVAPSSALLLQTLRPLSI